jgi:dihydrofolate synthase/folylpolyglutamate synthase
VNDAARRDWDYRRALAELWRRSSYERGLISDPFGDSARAEQGLVRMRALLAALGDPQRQVPTVHVAGSKGKGSTAAFIQAAAAAAGHRVGLYTSPHLHRFPERIAVDAAPLPDPEFAAVAETVARAAAQLEAASPNLGQVTTFELITAMGFVAFARRRCDLAVIEVGLGGRYDATNVLHPIVSVITRIDLEHTAVLGPTHAAIAAQKAGILRPGVPSVASPQVPAAAQVIVETARDVGAPLLMAGRDWTWRGSWRSFAATGPWGVWEDLALAIPGPHQVENACTALAALFFVDRVGIGVLERAARAGLASARWPGRFERVHAGGRHIVFDGAHTPAAAAALVDTWRDVFPAPPAQVIVGMGADKDAGTFFASLRPLLSRLIVTRSESPRAAPPAALAVAAAALGVPCEIQPSVAAAMRAAAAGPPGALLVTGSLFVVGEGREAVGLAAPDRDWQALMRAAGVTPAPPDRA